MRKGTLIAIVVLFVMIIAVAIVQIVVASDDGVNCPGPVASPNALPSGEIGTSC